MPVKVKKADISVDRAIDELMALLAPRLEAVGDRIVDVAKSKAPVGHGERQGKPESIRVRLSGRGLSALQGRQLKQIHGGALPEEVFRAALAGRPRSQTALEAQHQFAKLFRFSVGGGIPERVDLRRVGKNKEEVLRGFRRTKPHLRDTIRNEGVVRDGNRLKLTVAARSDHANLVEKGLHHKGGGAIAARPFLYPALEAVRDGLADGSLLKG